MRRNLQQQIILLTQGAPLKVYVYLANIARPTKWAPTYANIPMCLVFFVLCPTTKVFCSKHVFADQCSKSLNTANQCSDQFLQSKKPMQSANDYFYRQLLVYDTVFNHAKATKVFCRERGFRETDHYFQLIPAFFQANRFFRQICFSCGCVIVLSLCAIACSLNRCAMGVFQKLCQGYSDTTCCLPAAFPKRRGGNPSLSLSGFLPILIMKKQTPKSKNHEKSKTNLPTS